ncbi:MULTISPECIES: Ail/Lom family outer membrane beta-barrel protein [Proteus]|uniref:Ail/Lom family outer membrane beta-barrel protein n=1 Tax=Proteus TaxID=583 RepID=UPI0013790874|nr:MULTISPECIES: Ail/Lom family outer membrane beta-barrel protein [Proteus]MCX2587873.1 Ail/Lom family outer membrane beta-barrel protein [Proteus penneri]NBL77406.1 Ail/Lom family outer membrane beta-barrel protein [Proteus sp. G2672]NBM57402.1 Ail/Lom family outer membrane beta-barrel protein [Proteus sp. G2667]
MKTKLLSALFISSLLAASSVYAQEDLNFGKTTLSAGYAQLKMEGQKPMHGGTISLRQELNQQLGVLITGSYAQKDYDLDKPVKQFLKDVDTRYYSVMAGPTLRLNDYLSVYGAAGISQIEMKNIKGVDLNETIKKNAFSWGAGLIINPAEMVSISLGYENSRYKLDKLSDSKIVMDGFIANIGYRF